MPEELPTPAAYVVALHTATHAGRRTPYADTLLDGLHLALLVHGPIVVLTRLSDSARLVSPAVATVDC
jgi:hypothetical protein